MPPDIGGIHITVDTITLHGIGDIPPHRGITTHGPGDRHGRGRGDPDGDGDPVGRGTGVRAGIGDHHGDGHLTVRRGDIVPAMAIVE